MPLTQTPPSQAPKPNISPVPNHQVRGGRGGSTREVHISSPAERKGGAAAKFEKRGRGSASGYQKRGGRSSGFRGKRSSSMADALPFQGGFGAYDPPYGDSFTEFSSPTYEGGPFTDFSSSVYREVTISDLPSSGMSSSSGGYQGRNRESPFSSTYADGLGDGLGYPPYPPPPRRFRGDPMESRRDEGGWTYPSHRQRHSPRYERGMFPPPSRMDDYSRPFLF